MAYNMKQVLKVTKLRKSFGSFAAVKGVSLSIGEGEILGLLGPNGAGKTTTIQTILGLTKPTSGQVEMLGMNMSTDRQKILARVGYVSTDVGLRGSINVWENLMTYAYLYGVKDRRRQVETVLKNVEMLAMKHKGAGRLSAGQQTRVMLARALLCRPKLLFLDEPTASLDPEIVIKIHSLLKMIRGKYGVSMLLTSHNMAEVAKMCDRVVFLRQGRVVVADTPKGLARLVKGVKLELGFEGNESQVKSYLSSKRYNYQLRSDWQVMVKCEEEDIAGVMRGLSETGVRLVEVEVVKPSLEDVFLEIARGGEKYVK